MTKKRRPTCFIIAGPNGSGKTTFALRYLPEIAGCRNFVNSDLIAQGLAPLDTLSAQYEAGRLFLQEIRGNIDKGLDFAFETTLAGRSHISLLKELRNEGWHIVLFFLWIPSAAFSKKRVRERVEHGGHDIPEDTLYRRYPRIMYNLTTLYIPLCDITVCYDNTEPAPILAFTSDREGNCVFIKHIYEQIVRWSDDYKKNR